MTDKSDSARLVPSQALCVAALVVAISASGAAEAGDAIAGKRVFARCQACHQVGPNARNVIGPELNGLVGRISGTVAGYNYSPALKSAAILWGHDTLASYIANPQSVAKGTKMTSPGQLKPADVDDLVSFLATFATDGSAAVRPSTSGAVSQ